MARMSEADWQDGEWAREEAERKARECAGCGCQPEACECETDES